MTMLSVTFSRIRQLYSSAQTLGLFSQHNVFSTSANSYKQRGRYSRSDRVTGSKVGKFQLSAEDAEHFEALEDFINQEGSQPHGLHLQRKTEALLHREMKERQGRVKKKIMEKKHFRQPQEVNLLTWSAKQQIRYLNQQFPDEWTPEHLADSFPVSVEGVRRLLDSSYVPRTEQEIARHDHRVLGHWHQLKEALALTQGPGGPQQQDELSAQFQHLLDSGKLPLMINAGGSSQLPTPPLRSEKPRRARMGLFESIVAGAPMVKAREEQQEKLKIQEENRSRDGVKLLKAIADFSNGHRHRRTNDHEEKGMSAFFSDRSVKRR